MAGDAKGDANRSPSVSPCSPARGLPSVSYSPPRKRKGGRGAAKGRGGGRKTKHSAPERKGSNRGLGQAKKATDGAAPSQGQGHRSQKKVVKKDAAGSAPQIKEPKAQPETKPPASPDEEDSDSSEEKMAEKGATAKAVHGKAPAGQIGTKPPASPGKGKDDDDDDDSDSTESMSESEANEAKAAAGSTTVLAPPPTSMPAAAGCDTQLLKAAALPEDSEPLTSPQPDAGAGADEEQDTAEKPAAEAGGTQPDPQDDTQVHRMRSALLALRERRAELQEVNAELDESRAETGALTKKLKDSESAREELKSQLGEATADLEQAQHDTVSARSELANTAAELKNERQATSSLSSDLSDTRAKLYVEATAKMSLEAKNKQLQASLEDLQKQLAAALKSDQELQATLNATRTELASARQAESASQSQVKALTVDLQDLRYSGAATVGVRNYKRELVTRMSAAWQETWDALIQSHEKQPCCEDEGNERAPSHRRSVPSASVLRLRSVGPKKSLGRRRLSFASGHALTASTYVRSYKSCYHELWFPKPDSNVSCGKCQNSVPLQQGTMRGAAGLSHFTQHEFVCAECTQPTTASVASGQRLVAATQFIGHPETDGQQLHRPQDVSSSASGSSDSPQRSRKRRRSRSAERKRKRKTEGTNLKEAVEHVKEGDQKKSAKKHASRSTQKAEQASKEQKEANERNDQKEDKVAKKTKAPKEDGHKKAKKKRDEPKKS